MSYLKEDGSFALPSESYNPKPMLQNYFAVYSLAVIPPAADFDIVSQKHEIGTSLEFMDNSSHVYFGIKRWNWSFGDGEHSEDQNPIHQYSTAGNYSVKLTVTDSAGGKAYFEKRITVSGPENQSPSVTITDPSEGSLINGPFYVKGTAFDPNGIEDVDNVEVKIENETGHTFIDWSPAEKGSNWSHWKLYWNVTQFKNGPYTISAKAVDKQNAEGTDKINVTVVGQGGTGQITIINSAPEVKTVVLTPAGPYLNNATHEITVSGQVYDANWDTDVTGVTVTVYKPDSTKLVEGSATLSENNHNDGYLNYSYQFTLPSGSLIGNYTVNVTATDVSGGIGNGAAEFEVIEKIIPPPPIEIAYTGGLDYLEFGEIKAGASNVNSTNAFIVRNNQNHSVDVWFDISDFTSGTDDKISTVKNMKIWIWNGSAYNRSVDYDAVDVYLGTIATNNQMQIRLEILNIPEPLKTGTYTTTFGVYEG